MTDVLTQPAAHALARALGHFVWQGAAIGLAVLVALRLFRTSASARYLAGVSGLLAMLAAPVLTFAILANESHPAGTATGSLTLTAPITAGIVSTSQTSASPAATGAPSNPIDWQAVVLLAWIMGAAAFTLRLTGGWIVARRFTTRAVQPASEQIADLVRQLADRMEVRRAIAVVESAAVSVPIVIGWLKPTIVLPVAALAGLSPSQVEALIAHELAHVKRHDYLVNLLQSTVEALLFYHPAVWWLSRRVRAERELCCDDLAVSVCDRLVYATALTDLASMSSPRIALAATDGDLLGRVRRILGRDQSRPATWPGVAPLLTLAFVAAIVVPAALASPKSTPQYPATIVAPFGEESGVATPLPQTKPSPSPSSKPAPAVEPTDAQRDALWKQLVDLQPALEQAQAAELRQQATTEQKAKEAKEKEQLKAEAEIQRDQAIGEFERAKMLYEKGLLSQAQLSEIQNRVEEFNAKYSAAQQNYQSDVSGQIKQEIEQQLAELRRQLERMKQLQEKGLVSQNQVAEVQAALDKVAAQGNPQLARDVEMKALQQQLERTQELFQKGLVAQSQLEEARTALNKAAAQGNEQAALAGALRDAEAQLERARTLAAKGLMSSATVAELEQARATVESQLAYATEQREKTKEKTVESRATTDRAQADSRAVYEQQLESRKTRMTPLDAVTPAQARDVLNLKIANETGLPAVYVVGEDGTIRLPFLGSIKVAGLTAAQVREAVGKKLSEKKLGSVDQVSVTILRASRGQ